MNLKDFYKQTKLTLSWIGFVVIKSTSFVLQKIVLCMITLSLMFGTGRDSYSVSIEAFARFFRDLPNDIKDLSENFPEESAEILNNILDEILDGFIMGLLGQDLDTFFNGNDQVLGISRQVELDFLNKMFGSGFYDSFGDISKIKGPVYYMSKNAYNDFVNKVYNSFNYLKGDKDVEAFLSKFFEEDLSKLMVERLIEGNEYTERNDILLQYLTKEMENVFEKKLEYAFSENKLRLSDIISSSFDYSGVLKEISTMYGQKMADEVKDEIKSIISSGGRVSVNSLVDRMGSEVVNFTWNLYKAKFGSSDDIFDLSKQTKDSILDRVTTKYGSVFGDEVKSYVYEAIGASYKKGYVRDMHYFLGRSHNELYSEIYTTIELLMSTKSVNLDTDEKIQMLSGKKLKRISNYVSAMYGSNIAEIFTNILSDDSWKNSDIKSAIHFASVKSASMIVEEQESMIVKFYGEDVDLKEFHERGINSLGAYLMEEYSIYIKNIISDIHEYTVYKRSAEGMIGDTAEKDILSVIRSYNSNNQGVKSAMGVLFSNIIKLISNLDVNPYFETKHSADTLSKLQLKGYSSFMDASADQLLSIMESLVGSGDKGDLSSYSLGVFAALSNPKKSNDDKTTFNSPIVSKVQDELKEMGFGDSTSFELIMSILTMHSLLQVEGFEQKLYTRLIDNFKAAQSDNNPKTKTQEEWLSSFALSVAKEGVSYSSKNNFDTLMKSLNSGVNLVQSSAFAKLQYKLDNVMNNLNTAIMRDIMNYASVVSREVISNLLDHPLARLLKFAGFFGISIKVDLNGDGKKTDVLDIADEVQDLLLGDNDNRNLVGDMLMKHQRMNYELFNL